MGKVIAAVTVLIALVMLIDAEEDAAKKEMFDAGNATVNRLIDVWEDKFNDRALADIPEEWRQENWGTGSCVHASTVSLLRWQGLFELAEEWRRSYSGGEATAQEPHTAKMERFGLKYVVANGDDDEFNEFCEWAVATRRGFGVAHPRGHCVNCFGKVMHNGEWCAYVIDNNHPERPEYYEWNQFMRECRALGGHAFTFTSGKIPPPTPVY